MNELEQYIKLQADGFSLLPSEEVWKKICIELDQKKKRRGLFIWFFSLLFVSVTALLTIYNLPVEKKPDESSINSDAPAHRPNYAHQQFKEEKKAASSIATRSEEIIYQKHDAEHLPVSGETATTGYITGPTSDDALIPQVGFSTGMSDAVPAADEIVFTPDSVSTQDSAALIDSVSMAEKDSVDADSASAHFTIRLAAGVHLSNYYFEEHSDLGSVASFRNNNKNISPSYEYSMQLSYQLSNKLALHAGAALLMMNEMIDNKQLLYSKDTIYNQTSGVFTNYEVRTTVGYALIDSSAGNNATMKNKYTFLQLPVGLTWSLTKGKMNAGLSVYAGWVQLLNASYYRYDFESDSYIRSGTGSLRRHNILAGAGVELSYALSSRLKLILMPSYQTYLQSLHKKEAVLNQQYESGGMIAGFKYILK